MKITQFVLSLIFLLGIASFGYAIKNFANTLAAPLLGLGGFAVLWGTTIVSLWFSNLILGFITNLILLTIIIKEHAWKKVLAHAIKISVWLTIVSIASFFTLGLALFFSLPYTIKPPYSELAIFTAFLTYNIGINVLFNTTMLRWFYPKILTRMLLPWLLSFHLLVVTITLHPFGAWIVYPLLWTIGNL
jgi:hypothetical protein